MKKILIVTALLAFAAMQADAMSYTRARKEAFFLTDKMAYELSLTDDQYDAVYEINLDYYSSLIGTTDLFGIAWNRRVRELEYVLDTWQYRAFIAAEYFYRPVVIYNRAYRFAIYDRYAHNRFYRPAPRVYNTYRHGTRIYHNDPPKGALGHNTKPAPKPDVKPNKPNNGGHVGNGNHNGNVGKPTTGNHNGNVGNKPAGKPSTGNVTNAPKAKPSTGSHSGNVNSARRTSANAPARTGSTNVSRKAGNSTTAGASNGRRR
ncbi:MAG: hypothetical protein J5693_05215 [Bacteroidales bacterium]|nr:hypothetical protein [Bacteroidales bacterium]